MGATLPDPPESCPMTGGTCGFLARRDRA